MAESDDFKAATAGGAAYWRYLLLVLARKKWSVPLAVTGALGGVATVVTAVLGTR